MEIQNKEGNWRPNSVWPKVEVIADFRTHSLCAVSREQKMSLYMACKATYPQVASHSPFDFKMTQFSEVQVTMVLRPKPDNLHWPS